MTRLRLGVLAGLATALTTLTALTACGVPTDDHFRASRPPKGLTEAAVPTTATRVTTTERAAATTEPEVSTTAVPMERVALFFVRFGRLVPMVRPFPIGVTAERVLTSLLLGPILGETSVRTAASFIGVNRVESPVKGVATVSLTAAFGALPPPEQRLAIAQLVLTMTGLRGVGQVVFTRDGFPTAVPLPDGSSTSQPLSAEDFSSLLETPPDSSTTTSAATSTTSTSTTTGRSSATARRTRLRGTKA